MKVHLITVIGSHLDLLPHMLSHYKAAGIDSLIVNLQIEHYSDPLYAEAVDVCREFHATLYSVYIGPWLQHVNTFLFSQARETYPNDWFVLADLDEFQVYPQEIPKFLETVDHEGFSYVEGCVIDRLAADGGFPAVSKDVSIWDQFPLAGMLTYPLTGAAIHKVVAVKGKLPLTGGQHRPLSGKGYPRERQFIPVHHFKWTQGLDVRLSRRVEFFKRTHQPFGDHSERFVQYYGDYNGRIDINDPKLMIEKCYKDYPHWNALKQRVFETLTEKEKIELRTT
jgi:hypothetical protein